MFLKESFINHLPTEIENEMNLFLNITKIEDVCLKKEEVGHVLDIFENEIKPDYRMRNQNYSSLKTPNEPVPWVAAIRNSRLISTLKHYVVSALETPSYAQMDLKMDEFFGPKLDINVMQKARNK